MEKFHSINGSKKKMLLIGFVTALIGSVLLVLTFFTPFASANERYLKQLKSAPDIVVSSELDMTNKDMIDVSLFEYARVYIETAKNDYAKEISISCLVIIFLFAIFVLLTTLFTLLKKPFAMLIFSLISLGSFWLLVWDFADRKVVPSSTYDVGFGQCLGYIGVAIIFIGAILILIAKKGAKKEQ